MQHADGASDKARSSEAAHLLPWSQADIDAAQTSTSGRSSEPPSGFSHTFTNFVTQTYARYPMVLHVQYMRVCVVCVCFSGWLLNGQPLLSLQQVCALLLRVSFDLCKHILHLVHRPLHLTLLCMTHSVCQFLPSVLATQNVITKVHPSGEKRNIQAMDTVCCIEFGSSCLNVCC